MARPATRQPQKPGDRPPARIGCSGISLVCAGALAAFFFFSQVVAPALTAKLQQIELPALFSVVTPLPADTPAPDLGGLTPLPAPKLTPSLTAPPPEPTASPLPSPTLTATPTVTPTATLPPAPPSAPLGYVAVTNTQGSGVYIRTDPRPDAARTVAVPEKTILAIVGQDVTTDGQVWRNVRALSDNPQTGWVLAQYLAPSSGP